MRCTYIYIRVHHVGVSASSARPSPHIFAHCAILFTLARVGLGWVLMKLESSTRPTGGLERWMDGCGWEEDGKRRRRRRKRAFLSMGVCTQDVSARVGMYMCVWPTFLEESALFT